MLGEVSAAPGRTHLESRVWGLAGSFEAHNGAARPCHVLARGVCVLSRSVVFSPKVHHGSGLSWRLISGRLGGSYSEISCKACKEPSSCKKLLSSKGFLMDP